MHDTVNTVPCRYVTDTTIISSYLTGCTCAPISDDDTVDTVPCRYVTDITILDWRDSVGMHG